MGSEAATAHRPRTPATCSFTTMWIGPIDDGGVGLEVPHGRAVKGNLQRLLALASVPGAAILNRSASPTGPGSYVTGPRPATSRRTPTRLDDRGLVTRD